MNAPLAKTAREKRLEELLRQILELYDESPMAPNLDEIVERIKEELEQ